MTDQREALRRRIGVTSVKAKCGGDHHAVVPMVRVWPLGNVERHYEWLVEYANGAKKVNHWREADEELMLDAMLWHSQQWEVRE